jgi:hypothetical protein
MNGRLVANSLCGTLGIVSLAALLGKHLGFPWASDALILFKGAGASEINWDGFWLVALVASVVTSFCINLKIIEGWVRLETPRDCNMNVCEAIHYIAGGSSTGVDWPAHHRLELAKEEIFAAAKNGKIVISGLPEGSTLRVELAKHWYGCLTTLDTSRCRLEPGGAFLRERLKVLFTALLVDEKDIKRMWPPKRRLQH